MPGQDLAFYAAPGPLTELSADQVELIRGLDPDPRGLCRAAQGLVVSPPDAAGAGLSEHRMAESNTRPARALVGRVLELDAAPLDRRRPAERRVVGTCRHFAVMATAFLRAIGVPARARCGFATYFVAPQKVDHWIVEYWSPEDRRWIRIDPEYVGRDTPGAARAEDLLPGEFLTAGEAWQLVRSGQEDAALFGVFGTENWGAGEIRGNAMRDLASLVDKVEMLPWDVWGPMEDSYDGTTGREFDGLIDQLAAACGDHDEPELERVYEQLAVPASLIG
ncbi:MAG TPA: transglutaminase-like domain-containing protein [Iamia sp.]|nr:transglutaminase-like domain-containing protein [Iamia sp.]